MFWRFSQRHFPSLKFAKTRFTALILLNCFKWSLWLDEASLINLLRIRNILNVNKILLGLLRPNLKWVRWKNYSTNSYSDVQNRTKFNLYLDFIFVQNKFLQLIQTIQSFNLWNFITWIKKKHKKLYSKLSSSLESPVILAFMLFFLM